MPDMAFDSLKGMLKAKLPGVGEERIAVRTQGCWSCIHSDFEKAKTLWWESARGAFLAKAVKLSLESPKGEEHPVVRNIREMVPKLDTAVEAGGWACCSKGKNPDGTPIGDFVASTYLCDRWSARQGASVAREGQAADKLPEELVERIHERKVE